MIRGSGRVRTGAGGEAAQSLLEERTLQLHSVQRNYETMSRMMSAKSKEIDEVTEGGEASWLMHAS